MKKSLTRKADAALRFLARPKLFFWLLIWLMILLVAGTVSEKYLGLYASQKLYFSSFAIWLGGVIPVPGGYTTLALIFVNLLAKLASERWTKAKTGTLVIHCGALLLLIGGFLTATFSYEGNMAIAEGASSHFVSSYHKHELAVTDAKGGDIVFPQSRLQPDEILASPALPFTIRIEQFCENCAIARRAAMLTDGSVHGMLVANDMKPAPLSPDEAQNMPGVIFSIAGAGAPDGRYAIFEDMPITQHLDIGGKAYTVELRHQRAALPFDIRLIKFTKELYPGTDKARGFSSEVVLTDGALQWHSLISMNRPLRYKGYTFYQASFIDGAKKPTTVLAVVKNIGAIFPYIASITICIGMLIHLFIRIPKLRTGGKA